MNNNDVLRRLRYTFEFSDYTMINMFALADATVSRAQISNWLKKDDDPDFETIYDKDLATFLNGFINDRRGKREGAQPAPEKSMTNNIIFRKIRIALELRDEEILAILKVSGMEFSKHELSALFRRPGQEQYKVCKDQVLRKFLQGLQLKFRP